MKNPSRIIFIIINCLLTFFHQVIYHYLPGSDSILFLDLSKQYSQLNFFDCETNYRGHQLYALFLTIVGNIFSYHHYFIGLFQTIIYSIAALLLTSALEKQLNRNLTGLLLVLILVPEIYFFNGFILTESLAFTLIILCFYQALRIYNNSHATVTNMLLLSFTLAVTLMNRLESFVIIFPLLYLIYPAVRGRARNRLIIFFSIPLMLFQLNGYRNYKTFNVYRMSAFNGGEAIFGGNSANLDGSHHAFWDYKEIFIPRDRIEELNKILSEPDCISCPKRDAFFLRLAAEAWQKDPLQQMAVIPEKLAKNWLLPGTFDVYTADTTKTRGLQLKKILSKEYFNNAWYAPYKHLFYMLIHWTLLAVLITGMFRFDRQNRFQKSVLLLFVSYLFLAIPFCGLPRWHVAVFPLLIITFTPVALINRLNNMLNRLFTSKHG